MIMSLKKYLVSPTSLIIGSVKPVNLSTKFLSFGMLKALASVDLFWLSLVACHKISFETRCCFYDCANYRFMYFMCCNPAVNLDDRLTAAPHQHLMCHAQFHIPFIKNCSWNWHIIHAAICGNCASSIWDGRTDTFNYMKFPRKFLEKMHIVFIL